MIATRFQDIQGNVIKVGDKIMDESGAVLTVFSCNGKIRVAEHEKFLFNGLSCGLAIFWELYTSLTQRYGLLFYKNIW